MLEEIKRKKEAYCSLIRKTSLLTNHEGNLSVSPVEGLG